MKLLVCTQCGDTIALGRDVRTCRCGKVSGHYLEDGHAAEARGPYVAFGIHSGQIAHHVRRAKMKIDPPSDREFRMVEAWVMPKDVGSLRKVARLTTRRRATVRGADEVAESVG